MSVGRTLAVVVVSVLLTATLVGATVATGVNRTALNDEYVTEQFENEGVDAQIGSELRTDIATEIDRSNEQQRLPTGISIELDGKTVANRSVTDEFVTAEMNRSIEAILRYLRGDADELTLSADLREIKERVRTEIADGTTVRTAQLVGANSDRVSADQVSRLERGEQSYRESRLDLSAAERDAVESEIETNVRRQLSNDSEALAGAILDHQYTVLDGLTGELSHDEYVEQLAADERQIKAEIATLALAEVPDEQSLFGEESDPESALDPIRAGTTLVTTFVWLLPLFAVSLVGVSYLVTRSVDRTATRTGICLLVAGLLGWLAGGVAGPAVKSTGGLDGDDSDGIIEGMIAVVDGTLGTIASQSLVLAVAGVVVLGTVVADRRGLFDGVRARLNLDSRSGRQ
jgi:hypothetical protein